jgi:hypothetical protein
MGKIKSSGTKAAAKSGTEQTNNSKTISDDSFKSNFNHHDEQTKKSSSIGKMQLKTIKKAKRERPGILKVSTQLFYPSETGFYKPTFLKAQQTI